MSTFQNITEQQIAEIAALHGFDWSDEYDRARILEPEARQADSIHGKPCLRLHDGRKHWGSDARGDFYDAAALFDGYLRQTVYENECDCAALSDFHRNAYGD